jgi:hypothetical protein
MDRDELGKLTLHELRELARRRGFSDADGLRRSDLIDRLGAPPASSELTASESREPSELTASEGSHATAGLADSTAGLLDKARQVVRRAAEKAAERLRSHLEAAAPPSTEPAPAAPVTPAKARPQPTQAAPEPTDTETVARLYEGQGHYQQALEVYRKLLERHPERADLTLRIASLSAHRNAEAATPPAPGQRQGSEPGGRREPLGMLDYQEPPEVYGVDEVMAMPRDPRHLFVYWEVTPEGRASARARLGGEGHASRLVLRMYSVTVTGAGVATQEQDLELDWEHGRRVLPTPGPGVRVSVAVGLRSPSGAFAPIVHSGVVLVPHAEPGPTGPVEWLEVVPARRRGEIYEPVVIVMRGGERVVRGVFGQPAFWQSGRWHHPGSRVPQPPPAEGGEGAGGGVGGPSSPWLRWPGSSEQQPHGAGNR